VLLVVAIQLVGVAIALTQWSAERPGTEGTEGTEATVI
jgi:hypothetical protein